MLKYSFFKKITLHLEDTLGKNYPWIIISIILALFILNCSVAIYQVNNKTRNEFNKQLRTLSRESKQLIANNYTIVEAIAHDLSHNLSKDQFIQNFKHSAKKIGKYTSHTLLLADSSHTIVSVIPKTPVNLKRYSVANRSYIKMVQSFPDEIHIGHIVQGVTTKVWALPIAKGVFNGKKHLGTVILSLPLTEFSNGLKESNLILKEITFGTKKDLSFYLPENDYEISLENYNKPGAFFDTLNSIITLKHDIAQTSVYEPISGVFEKITLIMPASQMRLLFWKSFVVNLLNFLCILALLALAIFLIKYQISRRLDVIEDKMLSTVRQLKSLIPGYSVPHVKLTHTRWFHHLENLADRAASGISTVQNLMEQKNQQIQALQKHFIGCISAFTEKNSLVMEKINDSYKDFSTIKALLQQDHQQFFDLFEKIYESSKNYEENTQSLEEATLRALQIVSSPKQVVFVEEILRSYFSEKHKSVVTNTNTYNGAEDILAGNTPRMLYEDAFKECLSAILSISDNGKVVISNTSTNTTIEISFSFKDNEFSPPHIHQQIEKARLFALLDEGLICLFRSNHLLVVTIVYGLRSQSEILGNPQHDNHTV